MFQKISLILITALFASMTFGSTPKKDRLVVFADKKEGEFKTDRAIRPGTTDNLEYLKLVGEEKGVHACYVGNPENIKPIVNGMVVNSNKSKNDGLKLSTFETKKSDDSSIQLEIISDPKKSVYIKMKIGPC